MTPTRRTSSTVGLAVQRVAVVHRGDVAQFVGPEVGDRSSGDVRHAHPEQQGVDERPDDDVAPAIHLGLGVVGVDVQRADRHREEAEQVVLRLGDRLARPVGERVARLVVLEVPAEAAVASDRA